MASNNLKEIKKLLDLAASVEGKPSFTMQLAKGNYHSSLLSSFDLESPYDEKFTEITSWLNDYLTNYVDPIEVSKNSKVPASVLDMLSRRVLGAKIKKQYGGLELNTLQYCFLMRILSSNCSALGIWFTANCSIGLSGYLMVVYDSLKKELNDTLSVNKRDEIQNLIKKTEWQMKEFLPKIAAGANAGFGLTQVTAGSDPMAMIGTDTIAERTDDGNFRIRGHKLYNTNGTISEYEVVMAPLAPTNSICTFIVPTSGYGEFRRTACEFEGNRGIENALIQFDVKVPESFLVGRETGHDGLKNAFRTLNVGRLAMAAGSSATIANCLQISRWWGKERVQKIPVGKFKKNSIRIAKMACDAFAVEAIMQLGSMMYDRQKHDTDLRLETAAIKLWSTERAIDAARTNEKVRSGRGYETYESQARRAKLVEPHEIPLPDNTFSADSKVLWIGEGTNDVQQQIITGMIFAPHAFKLMPILDLDSPLKALKTFIASSLYYGFWIPIKIVSILSSGLIYWFNKLLFGFIADSNYWYIKYASSKLALKSLWLMIRYGTKLLREQVVTSFIANQLTELWVMSAVCWYAEKLYPKYGEIVKEIANVHCGYAIARINGDSEDKPHSTLDNQANKLGNKVIFEDAAEFLEKGIATVLERELKRWSK